MLSDFCSMAQLLHDIIQWTSMSPAGLPAATHHEPTEFFLGSYSPEKPYLAASEPEKSLLPKNSRRSGSLIGKSADAHTPHGREVGGRGCLWQFVLKR